MYLGVWLLDSILNVCLILYETETSLAVQWLGLCAFTAAGMRLIPGRGNQDPASLTVWQNKQTNKQTTTAKLFSKMVKQVCISTSNVWAPILPHSHQHLVLSALCFFKKIHSKSAQCYLLALICISLMTNGVEFLFKGLFATHSSYLVQCPFSSLAHSLFQVIWFLIVDVWGFYMWSEYMCRCVFGK